MTTLEDEIRDARREISTDGYSISIGELTNMYTDGELIVSPDYQRLFRWDLRQKSQLIESILIGIPVPSIFVAQDNQGRWEIVDGLQRISTLLEFQGVLKAEESSDGEDEKNDESPKTKFASVLGKTEYLPSIDGVAWSDEVKTKTTPKGYLSDAQRRDIKRSKIDVKIVKRDSDIKTKYDLFKRLNSNGSSLKPQEIRTAVLASQSSDMVKWICQKANTPNFFKLLGLSKKRVDQKYNEELLLRFLTLSHMSNEKIADISDFAKEVDEFSLDFAVNFESKKDGYGLVFDTTFKRLSEFQNIFNPWDNKSGKYSNKFTLSAFEAFAAGLGFYIANDKEYNDNFEDISKSFWINPNTAKTTGVSTEARIKRTVLAGRELLAK